MKEKSIIDIIAYYISEHEIKALPRLGYETQAECFRALGIIFGVKDSYIRRLRDEYDVVTSNPRNGQKNRPPRERITRYKNYFKSYSFEELSEIVEEFIENRNNETDKIADAEYNTPILSEEEIEYIINYKDPAAKIKKMVSEKNSRTYNTGIIKKLKKVYNGKCQICGDSYIEKFNTDITEAHHIEYFYASQNNDASNIIILCPNHHRLIHKCSPEYNKETKSFKFKNGVTEHIKINFHL